MNCLNNQLLRNTGLLIKDNEHSNVKHFTKGNEYSFPFIQSAGFPKYF